MSTLSKIFSNEYIKAIIIGVIIASATTTFNYILFIQQFNLNSRDQALEQKLKIIRGVYSKSLTVIEKGNGNLRHYFQYRLMLNKWVDSVGRKPTTVEDDLIREDVDISNPNLKEKSDQLHQAFRELSIDFFIAEVFFSTRVDTLMENFMEKGAPQNRYKMYDYYISEYQEKYKTNLWEVDLHEVSDSISSYYDRLLTPILYGLKNESKEVYLSF